MKFTIISSNHKKINEYINVVHKFDSSFKYVDSLEDSEFIFVFGGDNTFFTSIKNNIDIQKKFIFINEGRLGFLRSFPNNEITSDILKDELYQHVPYLEVELDSKKECVINEIEINFDKLVNNHVLINNIYFKDILTSRIFLINSLGSTGKARSYLYPIIYNFNSYILHFLEEPIYQYNKPLLQPLLFSSNEIVSINLKEKKSCFIKIDNKLVQKDLKNVKISQKKSKLKVLNLLNVKILNEKINVSF